jgi:hypothetical protein
LNCSISPASTCRRSSSNRSTGNITTSRAIARSISASSVAPPASIGRKVGRGFYAYADGKQQRPPETPAPKVDADAPSVWVSARHAAAAARVREILAAAGARIETGDRPSADALIVLTPFGEDCTTAALAEGVDPARAVAVDCLMPLDRRRTLMRNPLTRADRQRAAHALLGADGAAVTVINDSPGFIAQRILACVVNVGSDIAQQRVAAPDDINRAVELGLGYPRGPLRWGDDLGPARVLDILDNMRAFYGDMRYRPSPWLKRRARLGVSLMQADAPLLPLREKVRPQAGDEGFFARQREAGIGRGLQEFAARGPLIRRFAPPSPARGEGANVAGFAMPERAWTPPPRPFSPCGRRSGRRPGMRGFSRDSAKRAEESAAASPSEKAVAVAILLAADLALDDLAEGHPALTLEFDQLHLLDRVIIRRAGVERDAGQQHVQLHVLQALRLLQNVLARQVVAGLAQHRLQRLHGVVAVDMVERVALVRGRSPLVQEGQPLLQPASSFHCGSSGSLA